MQVADNLFTSNFKKNLIYVLKGILFLFALIPMIFVVGNKYSAASTENQINNYNESRWNEFYELPKNSLDMVFLGSSHSYCTFDPENFDSVLLEPATCFFPAHHGYIASHYNHYADYECRLYARHTYKPDYI